MGVGRGHLNAPDFPIHFNSEVVLEMHFQHPKRDVTLNKYLVLIGKGLFPQGLRLIYLEQYFTANDIQDAQKQPAIFISA